MTHLIQSKSLAVFFILGVLGLLISGCAATSTRSEALTKPTGFEADINKMIDKAVNIIFLIFIHRIVIKSISLLLI